MKGNIKEEGVGKKKKKRRKKQSEGKMEYKRSVKLVKNVPKKKKKKQK